ncbi:O-antigen biosynthesis protein [Ferrigenium kumadai]|uniref:O-antigen biosynthesis protein n=2 Tax=Ferrigenium kumadai TaxID=1682490 RepID=A0AAN1T0Z6_9PROT|nr:O-antigen biosynthesis protein [Ferrigenium kumadai]
MSTILIGFTVPISVALDNLLLAVVLLGAIFNARAVWQLGAHHPVARAALLLFGWLFVAMFYGTASLSEAAGILGKYLDLAFIPLFMLLLTGPRERQWAQYSFLASMGLTLLLSYLVGLGILAPQHWMCADAGTANPVIFHSHITQNNMMAFAAFLALLNMRKAFSRRAQLAWGVFALLAMVNVLFMVQGRTGYMILSILLAWSAWSALCGYFRSRGKVCGWKQGLGLLLALVGFALAAYYTSPRLSERVSQVSAEYQVWQPNRGGDSSTGLRLDFYYNTLHIVQQHPLFGVGTGGFPEAYAQQTQGKDVMKIRNPHNEYLMIAAQTGVFGLLLLLHLFYAQWRNAPGLDTPFERDAARGLVLAYMVNCLFNSALLDHADGLFFAFMTAVLFAGMNREKKIG